MKFLHCSDESSAYAIHIQRSFNEMVGVPAALHFDNNNNFEESILKRLLRKFVSGAKNIDRINETAHPPINVTHLNVDPIMMLLVDLFRFV